MVMKSDRQHRLEHQPEAVWAGLAFWLVLLIGAGWGLWHMLRPASESAPPSVPRVTWAITIVEDEVLAIGFHDGYVVAMSTCPVSADLALAADGAQCQARPTMLIGADGPLVRMPYDTGEIVSTHEHGVPVVLRCPCGAQRTPEGLTCTPCR